MVRIWDRGYAIQDGAPKIAKLPFKWLYGRYNELVNRAYFMVYKPTIVNRPYNSSLTVTIIYGRYPQLQWLYAYFMVYKPTFTSLGGPILYRTGGS